MQFENAERGLRHIRGPILTGAHQRVLGAIVACSAIIAAATSQREHCRAAPMLATNLIEISPDPTSGFTQLHVPFRSPFCCVGAIYGIVVTLEGPAGKIHILRHRFTEEHMAEWRGSTKLVFSLSEIQEGTYTIAVQVFDTFPLLPPEDALLAAGRTQVSVPKFESTLERPVLLTARSRDINVEALQAAFSSAGFGIDVARTQQGEVVDEHDGTENDGTQRNDGDGTRQQTVLTSQSLPVDVGSADTDTDTDGETQTQTQTQTQMHTHMQTHTGAASGLEACNDEACTRDHEACTREHEKADEVFATNSWFLSVFSVSNYTQSCCQFGTQFSTVIEGAVVANKYLQRAWVTPRYAHQKRLVTGVKEALIT